MTLFQLDVKTEKNPKEMEKKEKKKKKKKKVVDGGLFPPLRMELKNCLKLVSS